MAVRDADLLKQAFEVGKSPTQQDFHDLIDSAIVSNMGVIPITPDDIILNPLKNKRYLAIRAVIYNNLRRSNGTVSDAITVSDNELLTSYVFLDYFYAMNTWTKTLLPFNVPSVVLIYNNDFII